MAQYARHVKPMHEQWVEPSKTRADVIVNSETGHSLDLAIKMISDHLLVASGILSNEGGKGEEHELSQA